jgi:hypothetical protein
VPPKQRFKTVELMIEEVNREPKIRRMAGDTVVRIRVALPEKVAWVERPASGTVLSMDQRLRKSQKIAGSLS